MKRIVKYVLAAAMLVLAATSCNESSRKKALLPNISGKAGEVIVVINKSDWEGALGTELRDFMSAECPFLPQKEPLYTLVDVVPTTFTNLFKVHRNIILFNVSPNVTNPGISYLKDQWAAPQCVVNVNAPDSATATELIHKDKFKIMAWIEQAERDRVIANTTKFGEVAVSKAVADNFGGSFLVPSGFSIKKKTKDFYWISYETTYIQQGFFIYRFPASGKDDLTKENLVSARNAVLKENVPGMFENTYMTTSTFAEPSLEYLKFKGREFANMRGFWEVENDYMGGPFVSHSFYSPDAKYIYVVEAYVYAPKYDKRHYLRQVESLLYSFQWNEAE